MKRIVVTSQKVLLIIVAIVALLGCGAGSEENALRKRSVKAQLCLEGQDCLKNWYIVPNR